MKEIATPGRIAWEIASPINVMRLRTKKTPNGAAERESHKQATKARLRKSFSMKGCIKNENTFLMING